MARLRYNGLTATLGAAMDATQTSITFTAALASAAGAVPTIAGSDYIPLTVLDASGNVSEIVSLTAYTSGATTGTITRAQEGTTGATHAAGDAVVHSATVADFTSSGSAITRVRSQGGASADYSTASTAYADLDNTYFSVSIPAVAGDEIEVGFHCQAYQTNSNADVIFAVAVNGAVKAGWGNGQEIVHCDNGSTLYPAHLTYSFTVASGDIVSGSVTVKMQWKVGAGTGKVRSILSPAANANVPQMSVVNWKQ